MKKVKFIVGYKPTRKERKMYRLEKESRKAYVKEQLMLIMIAAIIKEAPAISGVQKRLKCAYEKPNTIPALIVYYKNFIAGMLADPAFASSATLLASASVSVQKLEDAEVLVQSKVVGSVTARGVQFIQTEVVMDSVLVVVQAAGDADPTNAGTIFNKHQLKIEVRTGHQRDDMEVLHGKTSGSFIVRNKPVAARAAYLWMISADKINWYVGDFSRNSSGLISKMNNIALVPGTKYYIKSQSDTTAGKSDFSNIIEMFCI